MSLNEKKINKLFIKWLYCSFTIVFLIIIVGGLTRLTNSGLSITEWELFEGILPPLNSKSWEAYFDLYKQIPQYKLLNFNMNLSEFKVIFYWEYVHRMLARLIGLFFLIPLIYFYLTKQIKKEYIYICILIFFFILFQGVIGWYMVKSGLVNDVTVSHYRLSIHLIIAIIIFSSIFWLLKNFYHKKNKSFFCFSKKYLPYQFLIIIIFLQIAMGAFVSGLDAGMIYQTWPMMGNSFFPNDILFNDLKNLFKFNNHSLVQLYHRILAYLIVLYVFFISINIFKNKKEYLYRPLTYLLLTLILQVFLGIVTLTSGLNIFLASAHQIVGVLLVFSAINLYYLITN